MPRPGVSYDGRPRCQGADRGAFHPTRFVLQVRNRSLEILTHRDLTDRGIEGRYIADNENINGIKNESIMVWQMVILIEKPWSFD